MTVNYVKGLADLLGKFILNILIVGKYVNPIKLPLQTSKDAIEALTQMTFHYATKCLAKDLVAFCKHANRKTITGKPR